MPKAVTTLLDSSCFMRDIVPYLPIWLLSPIGEDGEFILEDRIEVDVVVVFEGVFNIGHT